MPVHEIEIHPFLQIGESITSNKIIIGTFPIYGLTNPRTHHKDQLRQERGDMSFFYGSRSNCFWSWYQQYIDNSVNIENPLTILASLEINKIAISDVIFQCSRINESFEDSQLRNIVWNYNLAALIEANIDKVICTSKSVNGAMGWLCNRILIPFGFILNKEESDQLHNVILNSIPNCNTQIKLVTQVLTKGGKKVSIVALPSPGSPYRRLSDFGRLTSIHDSVFYLDSYLQSSFNWFIS